jgi:hypothetical protein
MLLKLSDPVAECLRRAKECGRLSKTAIDAASKRPTISIVQHPVLAAALAAFGP